MNTNSPGDRPDDETACEAAINALIDGDLDASGRAALKAAAADDPELAQAIVDAWRLQEGLDELRLERAPSRLTRRLLRIPKQQRRASVRWFWPRRVAAGVFASAALAAFAMMMVSAPEQPGRGPLDAAERVRAEAARRELRIAFHYLEKAGARAGLHVRGALHDAIAEPVTERLYENIPYTGQSREEEPS